MQIKEYPVWIEGLTPLASATGALPERADVVVIGGGFSGLAAARELARRGVDTVLLEAHSIGWGASSRNGGMVLTGLKLGPDKLVAHYGHETAKRMFDTSLAAIRYVEQLVETEQIDCHFVRQGHLVVASKPSHYRALATEAELLEREFGHHTSLVPAEQLQTEIGSQAFYGGHVDEQSAGVNPARYVYGLAVATQRAGAKLFDQTRANAVVQTKQGWQIATNRGNIQSKQVMVATGGYTGPATPSIRRRVIPIGSYIIATEPLSAELVQELSPKGRMIYDTRNFLYYFRITPDKRMLFGGRASFFPETRATVQASAEILKRGMLDVYPQLHGVQVEYAWGGNVDFTFDMMPHVGEAHGLRYALGYAGHGVALASYLGAQLGIALAGGTANIPFGQPLPGAPLGLYNGRPWFLPFAGAWYKILDWLT